jgi:uncharacterized protein YgbK (DUF1537 family)
MGRNKQGGLLLSFYGDDFTGTTATAEALTVSGVPTVMFVEPPTPFFLRKQFPEVQAVGVAGISRSLPADGMEAILTPAFKKMKRYHAPLFLYKVCSTFDSSPDIGSIGKAVEIGRHIFSSKMVPILPAAPRFKRFTIFGYHFAAMGQEVFRLDRHPSMSVHPVTPMNESDLRQHLAKQTSLECGLIPVLILEKGKGLLKGHVQDLVAKKVPLVLFDALLERHVDRACSVIWDYVDKGKARFCAGSQEMGYGLARAWKHLNLLSSDRKSHLLGAGRKAGQILIVSGSCASVTGRQIEWASDHEFVGIGIHPERLFEPESSESEMKRVVEAAVSGLQEGKSAIIHSAIGAKDARISRTKEKIEVLGLSSQALTERLGQALGVVTRRVIKASGVTRLVLAGGDISGRITPALGIWALQVGRSVGIAAPLCYAYSSHSEIHGLQIALKGGQVGEDDYFGEARDKKVPDFDSAALGHFKMRKN